MKLLTPGSAGIIKPSTSHRVVPRLPQKPGERSSERPGRWRRAETSARRTSGAARLISTDPPCPRCRYSGRCPRSHVLLPAVITDERGAGREVIRVPLLVCLPASRRLALPRQKGPRTSWARGQHGLSNWNLFVSSYGRWRFTGCRTSLRIFRFKSCNSEPPGYSTVTS